MGKITTLGLTLIAAIMTIPAVHAQRAGSQPQVPISYGMWQRLQNNAAALSQLGAGLPPVAAEPGPLPAPPLRAPPGSPPSVFSPEQAPIGAWTNLANTQSGGPYNLSNPLLLTDGTVIVHRTDNITWWKLTPDINGSYVNGTWSQIASLPIIGGTQYDPKFFASAVLPDGRAIIEGGEYNNGASVWTNLGAIYDPIANTWTAVTAPSGWAQIGDAQSVVLTNGTYMLADCCDSGNKSALLNASTLTWSPTGTGKFDLPDEEAWALLPNGKVLTVDAYVGTGTCAKNTEIYDPSTGAWTSAGNVPAQLSDCNSTGGNNSSFEIGPNILTYNNSVMATGGTTSTTVAAAMALYNVTSNTWSAGANLPSTCGSGGTTPCNQADAPSAVMPNGNVLLGVSAGLFSTPANFIEYSPTGNSYAAAPSTADAASATSFYYNFLILPTGQVLSVSTYDSNIQVYTPSGTYNSSWQPVVTSVAPCVTPGDSYIVSGNQLNGLTQGAYYGDDQQASTNYPLGRIVNNGTGHVFYARTSGFSTMSIASGTAGSATFKVAASTETGASTLYVVANGIPSAGTPITVGPSGCSHDFNGDGKSDIAWRNTTGDLAIWLMNGTSVSSTATLGNVPTSWSVVGQRDFNGDGKSDLLWRDTSGNLAMWLMNGTSVSSTASLGNVLTSWSVVGTGDFNGDGKGDILWRDTSGNLAIWLMNGTSVSSTASLGNVPTSWSVVGTADFNGDGKSDILWRDTSGNLAIWLMNGTSVSSTASLGNVPTSWSVVGTADFNGDGKGDILWRDTSGNLAIWLMNGTSVSSSASLGNVPTSWSVPETGDFNGDGKGDILWSDTSGNVAIWLMNGTSVSSTAGIGNVPTSWVIQGANAD